MSRGYGRAILAAFGWLSLTGSSPPNEAAPRPATKEQGALIIPSASPAASPEPYASYPDKNAEDCYGAANHDSADLCAQWRAAVAAEKAASAAVAADWIAGGGALISLVSIVLIFIALLQTRNANRIAKREYAKARIEARNSAKSTDEALAHARVSAEATSELVTVSRETARAQLRAYLDFDGPHYRFDGRDEKEPDSVPIGIGIPVKNFGDTPAVNIRTDLAIAFLHEGQQLESERFQQDLAFISRNDVCTIRADFKVDGAIWKMDEALWEMLQTDQAQIQCDIMVAYDDAFGAAQTLTTKLVSQGSGFRFVAGTRRTT